MAYRVKLPPQDFSSGAISGVSFTQKSGDSGDQIEKTAHSAGEGVAAPSVCPPLPKGVRLVRYEPKKPPVAIAPISIVTDVDKFIRHYLEELEARLHSPIQIRCGGSVFEILGKLADVGLELTFEMPQRDDPKRDPAG